MKTSTILGCVVAALLAGPMAAQSALLYASPDVAEPNIMPGTAFCSSCNGMYMVTDIFTLTSASTITSVDFALYTFAPLWSQAPIQIGIYDTAFTTQLFLATTLPVSTENWGNWTGIVSAAFSGPSLAAGSYRMSWFDTTRMGIAAYSGKSASMALYTSNSVGSSLVDTGPWGIAFQVYGETSGVPEPATLALLGIGLAGIGYQRCKRAA